MTTVAAKHRPAGEARAMRAQGWRNREIARTSARRAGTGRDAVRLVIGPFFSTVVQVWEITGRTLRQAGQSAA
jgi:hypothetical protein